MFKTIYTKATTFSARPETPVSFVSPVSRWHNKSRPSLSLLCCLAAAVMSGCKELTGTQSLPSGVHDPSYYSTPPGALGMRNAADSLFENAFLQYVLDAGLLSDELTSKQTGIFGDRYTFTVTGSLDERILPQLNGFSAGDDGSSYDQLQQVRGAATQAIGALAAYYPAASPAIRGEMYAFQGYAEIMLADLYCSGIPLSTLDFQNDFTYRAGSTKEDVYRDAIAKFDTALALSGDSTRIMNLARVGLGRAYLTLGQYANASQAVESVPDGYQYQLMVQWKNKTSGDLDNNSINARAEVSNSEGGNGLPFLSSGDPRTQDTNSVIDKSTSEAIIRQLHIPKKYKAALTPPFYSPITLADWIEARLIRAEAALAVNDADTWLSQLNFLRQNATVSGQTDPLSQLSDPGISPDPTARVSLMFQERAYWLYMTGHRQGDLRRLIRQYGRSANAVYPTGDYLAPGAGVYGNDVTVPIPLDESPNPLFHGCIDRNA